MDIQKSCCQLVVLVHLLLFLSQHSCVFLEATTILKSSNVSCIKEERKALLELKHGFTDPLSMLDSWVGEDCCKWDGIVCNNLTGNVIELGLLEKEVSGSLSMSIGSLSYLEILDLSYNSISGAIPISLGNLSHLHTLQLSNNNFSGPIPASLGSLSHLKILILSFNSISGSIPIFLGNLSHLRALDLSRNSISGPIPASLVNLSHLHRLYLSSNSISGPLPASLGSLSHLISLNLFENSISGSIPTSIGNLSQLISLNLGKNSIFGSIPSSLGNLLHLKNLLLSNNSISGPVPTTIGNLSNLEILEGLLNSISGPLPTSIGNLQKLQMLELSYNPKLNGTIPESIGQLRELEILDLIFCSFEGFISENHFRNLTKLTQFMLSSQTSKSFVFNVSHDWIPVFNLTYLGISHCKLMNPAFPAWLKPQNSLASVILSNVGISDTVPDWFWRKSEFLMQLDLSYNHLQGKIPNSINSNLQFINLKNNNFVGSLPLISPKAQYLTLAGNKFSGPIPSNIGQEMSYLVSLDISNNNLNGSVPPSLIKMIYLDILDLSRNHLSGNIPTDWTGLQYLRILDLSNNNFFGQIPSTLCSQLPSLKWLRLSKNNLSGDLKHSFQHCNLLSALDLTGNEFSSTLQWIEENLHSLSYLLLGDNKFTGNIPQSLCTVSSLQVLDLSLNNLSGSIPRCLGNLKEMMEGSGLLNPSLVIGLGSDWLDPFSILSPGTIHMEFNLKGTMYEYTTDVIGLIKKLDLSSNNLQGDIPQEIRNLMVLGSLNLSNNHLTGKIPEGIGNLQRLEALDLSGNHLWGSIPSSMTNMTSLSKLNLSYNNLSGPIPSANQFLTFKSTSFEGNSALCGHPLQTQCGSPPTHDKGTKVDDEDDDKYATIWLYGITTLGFIVGFWVVFGSLVIKRSWRHAYFRFLDKTKDRLSFWY